MVGSKSGSQELKGKCQRSTPYASKYTIFDPLNYIIKFHFLINPIKKFRIISFSQYNRYDSHNTLIIFTFSFTHWMVCVFSIILLTSVKLNLALLMVMKLPAGNAWFCPDFEVDDKSTDEIPLEIYQNSH